MRYQDDKCRDLVQSIVEEQMRSLLPAQGRQDYVGRFGSVTLVAANALRHISRERLGVIKIESVWGDGRFSSRTQSRFLTVIEEALSSARFA